MLVVGIQGAKTFVNVIEKPVGSCVIEQLVQAENLIEYVIQPDTARGACKQVKILCKEPPYFP